MTHIGSTERRLALWVVYGILAAPLVAVLCREFGLGWAFAPWAIYVTIALPMIVMVSHPEAGVQGFLRWVAYPLIATPAINLLFRGGFMILP